MGIDFRNPRITGIIAILSATVLLFTGRLFDFQILQNDYFLERSTKRNAYTVTIPAVRGEIVDRNGNPLVTNRQGNAIILDAAYFPSSNDNHRRNPIILDLLNLFDAHGEEWVNTLPLELDNAGNVVFSEDSDTEIGTMKSKDNLYLAGYATAQDCFDRLVEKYELQDYSVSDALRIGAIRYELTLQSFSISNPVTIAEDVSDETVQIIKESGDTYLGADVQITAYREYVDGTLAPHIIGVTGKITAEEYQELQDQGYGMAAIIGPSGVAKAMEDYLRGESGEMTVTIEDDGSVTKEVTKQPKQGGTVVLTIDRDLQREAQDTLADVVAEVGEEANEPSAGAVVVQNVNTGEILAAASYPTYDLSTYREDYESLGANAQIPRCHRFDPGTC
ncbi:MAG: hypothetical protein LIO46_06520, partial [Clostridiales bacterium]|nr:hypothetical protein [Clostridiales bacterium]